MSINYEGTANFAVNKAKTFNINLDYSKNSIKELDDVVLENFYNENIECNDDKTDNLLWYVSIVFGIYIGETLLRNGLLERGFYWHQNNKNSEPALINNSHKIFPITKVYKRLKNGIEDNIYSFFDISIQLSDEKLELK